MDWTGILVGGAVGGVVMFVWYSVAWMALSHHKADFRQVREPEAIETALGDKQLSPGLYCIPHMDSFEGGFKDPALAKRMEAGPNVMILVQQPGAPFGGAVFGRSIAMNVCEGLLGAVLVALVGVHLAGLAHTLLLFLGVGVFAALIYGALSNWNMVTWRFAFTNAIDRVVAYLLLGGVLHFLGPDALSVV